MENWYKEENDYLADMKSTMEQLLNEEVNQNMEMRQELQRSRQRNRVQVNQLLQSRNEANRLFDEVTFLRGMLMHIFENKEDIREEYKDCMMFFYDVRNFQDGDETDTDAEVDLEREVRRELNFDE